MGEKKDRVLLCLNHLGGKEMEYVQRAIEGNWVVPLGPDVNAFEAELARKMHAGEVVALSTGTAAVHLALVALGVGAGDEVICQTMTFCASCNPIRYVGATPVLVDSERDTWNIDPKLLDEAICDRIAKTGRAPKAIVMVHLYGMPAKMHEIMAVAERYGIPVIEDAAEAMGSCYDGRWCGTMGKYGILSFNGNKMITTSGGGALICRDEEDRRRVMFYATQAREGYPYYQHEEIGYNYRMSNICAAIGRGQMEILDEHLAHHRMLAAFYEEAFLGTAIEFHSAPKSPAGMYDPNYWLSTILLGEGVRVRGEERAYQQAVTKAVGGAAGVTRAATNMHTEHEPSSSVEALRLVLEDENIESRPLWKPMHLQPIYAAAPAYVNGVSESLFRRGLCLPSGPYVSVEDARRIVDIIKASVC